MTRPAPRLQPTTTPRDWGFSDEQLATHPIVFRPDLLKGKVFLVSGGGSGMGRAMAYLFARLGADVMICGRRLEKLDTTAAGIETNTVGCGGLCLITDFKGDLMPGMTLHGHGITAWDSAAKKYVGTWTDSMSDGLATLSGSYDAASRTMTTSLEGCDTNGTLVKSRTVSEHRSPDTRVMTMFTTGANGEEVQIMRVTYVRRK